MKTSPVTGTPISGIGQPTYHLAPRPSLEHRLSDTQVAEYQDNGFTVVRGLITPDEAAFYRSEADRVSDQVIELCRAHDLDPLDNLRFSLVPDQQRAWKIDPITDVSPEFAALCRDRRICDRLACLYDGYEPRLFKDKLILKPAHSGGSGLHQDYNWWQGFPQSCLSVTIAFDRTTRANGCTKLWAMSNRTFLHQADSLGGNIDEKAIADLPCTWLELEPGDAAIFHCLTPHAADPNDTDDSRCAMFVSYNDSRDGEWRQAHHDHFFWYRTCDLEATERERHYVL